VKSNLSTAIKEKNINILEVDEHLTEISEVLKSKIVPGFEEYGLTIPEFFLTTIVLPEDNPNFKRLKELQTVLLQTRMARAEATVKTAEAQAEAEITAARRQVEMERQTTATEVAKREAERKVIGAEAEAEAARRTGFAEAEVMHAKGYNQKDVLEAEVQKAYAEGIGNMGSGSGGGGTSGGGIASDMVSMMAGMKMAGVMMDKMDGLNIGGKKEGNETAPAAPKEETIKCPKCGAELPAKAKFCLECGAKVEVLSENEIICPVCGKKTPKGKFCMECGAPLVRKCPNCGAELPTGAKFCLECGTKTE
jgi:membrane protease subunit (stomatin/prohibitin family)